MSDPYQAIFDVVRSRISNGDIGAAVQDAIREANLSHYALMAAESVRQAASQHERPCVLFRPSITIDGDQWCALYGENLQEGIAGFGDSPADAMNAFDAEYYKKLNTSAPTRNP